MINWLNNLKDENQAEYSKVLSAAEPGPGQRYSKFNLTQYKEQHMARKVRGVREDQEGMTFERYMKYHTEEIEEQDRMSPTECRAAWLRDLAGPDHEKKDVYSKKNQKYEARDIVWVTIGGPKRYKKKEEEESRSVDRVHSTASGSDSVATAAFKRMQNFVTLSGAK